MPAVPLLMLVCGLVASTEARVYVESSLDGPEVIRALEDELAPVPFVDTATAATHTIQLDGDEQNLLVAVRAGRQLVLARTIPRQDKVAARRIAVLLAARAVRNAAVPTGNPPPTATRRAPPPVVDMQRFSIAPQVLFTFWERPRFVPQLGLAVDMAYLEDGLGGGLSLSIAGGLCCGRSTNDVTGRAVEMHAIIEGRVPVVRLDGVRFGVSAGGGISGYFISARPVFLTSSSLGTIRDVRAVELVVRGGAEVWVPLDDAWAFVARASIRVSLAGGQILRPEAVGTEEPLGPGRVGPWLSAGIEWTLF